MDEMQAMLSGIGVFAAGFAAGYKAGLWLGEKKALIRSDKPVICSAPMDCGADKRATRMFMLIRGVEGSLISVECPWYRHRLDRKRRHWCTACHGRCRFFDDVPHRSPPDEFATSPPVMNPTENPTRKIRLRYK